MNYNNFKVKHPIKGTVLLESPKSFRIKQIERNIKMAKLGETSWKEIERQTGRTTSMVLQAIKEYLSGKYVYILVSSLGRIDYVERKILDFYEQLGRDRRMNNHLKVVAVSQSPKGQSTENTIVFIDNEIEDVRQDIGYDWHTFVSLCEYGRGKCLLDKEEK